MLRQNIVKIRGLQLVFIFAFYLSYFLCFLVLFSSSFKVIKVLFRDGALWSSGSQVIISPRLTLNSEPHFPHLLGIGTTGVYHHYGLKKTFS